MSADPQSGTGGYALLAQSELPILHGSRTPRPGARRCSSMGRSWRAPGSTRFRLRQGQDASCLNLYRPTSPTIIAPAPGFVDEQPLLVRRVDGRDRCGARQPWLLLERRFDDGAVPAVADATSLQYVLHARVGDTLRDGHRRRRSR